MDLVLGIDVGGSAIKAGAVDTGSGAVHGEPREIPTPQPATPAAVQAALRTLTAMLPQTSGPVGMAFPTVVVAGRARTAANVDRSWIGVDGAALVTAATGRPGYFLNDADAAGLAEMRFGAGRGASGTTLMLTFGTGIGSALFVDGKLWPNTELGHMEVNGREAEAQASARIRTVDNLGWADWARAVNVVLDGYQRLLWPDLVIVGGGISEQWASFGHLLRADTRIVPAELRQHAGLVGAAIYAAEAQR
jgi:polyphosphate glucokinase